MPIPATLHDLTVEPLVHRIDERWTMAFAAGLGLDDPVYVDTTRAGGVVAHPLFAVCPEWPVIVSSRDALERAAVPAAEVATGVHASHDLTVHRLIRPGDVLTTSLTNVAVEAKAPGARVRSILHTVDADGRAVATTRQDSIYLGVGVAGQDRPEPDPPAPVKITRNGDPSSTTIALAAGAAHVYTECARIWNPIHTDARVAAAVGLPGIILHGTANLAHGVSTVLEHIGATPDRVSRIVGRFAAMVPLPSDLTVLVWPATTDHGDASLVVPFEVLNADGRPAVANGAVVLKPLS